RPSTRLGSKDRILRLQSKCTSVFDADRRGQWLAVHHVRILAMATESDFADATDISDGASEIDRNQFVDPEVSRRKFDQEIAEYRRLEPTHLRRGWWLLSAEFPTVLVAFAAPQLRP